MDRQTQIGKAIRIVRDHHHGSGDSLKHLDLPYDDGATVHDEPALVATAEPARASAGENRRRDIGDGHESIMTEGHLGRLLPACLHQAIADTLPDRLEYYEEWLDPVGLRNGSIGLAPLSAVTGFLRTEGGGYDAVVARAGALAVRWSLEAMPPYTRRLGAALPAGLRSRFALRFAKRIVRDVFSASSATSSVARGRATLRVNDSVFCAVRERPAAPLCGFYQSLVVEALRAFQIPAEAAIASCQALDGGSCVIAVELGAHGRADRPAMAA